MALPLDVVSVRVTACSLGAISAVEEAFWGRFGIFRGEILSVETHISMKTLVCGGYFLSQVIKRLIQTTNKNRKVGSAWINVMYHIERERHKFFMWKLKLRKITESRRRFYYDSQVTGITENFLVCLWVKIDWTGRSRIPILAGREGLFDGGKWYGRDHCNCTFFNFSRADLL